VHPALSDDETGHLQGVRRAASYIQRTAFGGFRPDKWFPLERNIRTLWVPTLSSRFVPDGDVVLATAWATAEWVPEYPASKGEKFYLIQSWETWDGPEDRVRATWMTPLKKIVVGRWLRDIADELGVECSYIPNGIDFYRFGLDKSIENRDPNRVMMLYHTHPVKGSADGLEALILAQKELPGLRATLFGTSAASPAFPRWVDYRRLPSQRELRACYNRASIFIAPARTEGWPLPPAEAMSCGAALAATDIGGHREYGVHEETALLSPARDPGKLAENVLRLVRHPELRTRLARQGHDCIQKYGWEQAVDSFENILSHSRVPEFRGSPVLCAALDGGHS
jgi:glycosyltransferase involved in cell wall biosynthesis